MKKTRSNLLAAVSCIAVCLLAGTGSIFADPTGDPATDSGWTSEGNSASAGNFMQNAGNSADFSADVYSTAFTLASGSALLGPLGISSGWSIGDTIVGVGGVFTSSGNSSLTYDTANNTANLHLVVKYGSSAAAWTLSGTGLTAGSAGSLTFGGDGSVLLATTPETISSSSGFVTPNDAPTIQTTASGQVTLPTTVGEVGQVITSWNGSGSGGTLASFESFLDLTLLNEIVPTNHVGLGDEFVLDLQQGKGIVQNSLGTLPATITPAPEPTSAGCLLVGLGALACFQRLKIGRKA
jgi:hypothetical protein